jgi:RHS repeat-associated protein
VNGTWSFGFSGYDALNRLVSGSASAGHFAGLQMGWSYDSFGNRTSETFGGSSGALLPTSSSAQYNANNQVSASSLMSGAGLVYDAAGDVTQDNMNQYRYDAEGRVCAVYNGGSVMGYLYDAEGTRVAKGTLASFDCGSNFTVTSWYIVGPSGEQLTETDGAGNWKHTNVYAAGALIATYEANNTLFALSDWLGTKRVELGANNNCATAYTSLPFGDGLTPVAVSGYSQCPDDATEHHFTAKERDAESGNDYFGARYYSSNMGRFMSPDWSAKVAPVPYAKLDNPQSLNLYAYVLNNPLIHIDADGHIIDDSKLKDNKDYQKWKTNYLKQKGAQGQWDALNNNKDLTVHVGWDSKSNTSVTNGYAWNSKGALTSVNVNLGKGTGNTDNQMNAAAGYIHGSTLNSDGAMRQAYVIAHEFAHVEYADTQAGGANLRQDQQMGQQLQDMYKQFGPSFGSQPGAEGMNQQLQNDSYQHEKGADQRAWDVLGDPK